MGVITPVFQPFCDLPEHQATWHARVSQRTYDSWLWAFQVGFHHNLQWFDFQDTRMQWKYFPPKNISRASDGVIVTGSKGLWNIFSICQVSLLIEKFAPRRPIVYPNISETLRATDKAVAALNSHKSISASSVHSGSSWSKDDPLSAKVFFTSFVIQDLPLY